MHQHLHSSGSRFQGWDTEEKPVVSDGFCFRLDPSRTSLQLCCCWNCGLSTDSGASGARQEHPVSLKGDAQGTKAKLFGPRAAKSRSTAEQELRVTPEQI